MEKVQFQLEATLPELKDLHEKGLFSRDEIDQITRRRTHLETSLIRQGVRKEDFFKYAEYEINLEKLRRVRWKRLGYAKNPPPPSASLFSIPRRTMYILKRATVKFPGDLATWLAYVEYAGREGMRKIVTKGLTSALQHHPLSSTLYLLSSFHHVHPGAPFPRSSIPSASTLDLPSASADVVDEDDEEESKPGSFALEGTQPARTTLLLGLRMLPTNPDLWREYIKLELGWVEALRRRWKVLGIANTASAGEGGEGSFGPDGEDARKAILGGQLVLQAIKSALAAMPISPTTATNMAFRESLLVTLRMYPSPLRGTCLEVIYGDLERIAERGGRSGAQARLLLLTKGLYDRPYEAGRKDTGGVILSGVELVEELGKIGKEIRKGAKVGGAEFGEVAGIWLDQQIRENQENQDLLAYLLSILASLTKSSLHPTPTLLLLHLSHAESSSSPAEYHDLVQKYATLHPLHPELQLAYLRSSIESSPPSPASIRSLAEKLIKSFNHSSLSTSDSLIVRQIWTTWAIYEISSNNEDAMNVIWSKILRMSLGIHGTAEIHNDLLILHFDWRSRETPQGTLGLMPVFRGLISKYRPSPIFFAHALKRIVDDQGNNVDEKDIMRCHEAWKAVCVTPEDEVNEALTVAEVLIREKMVKEAIMVVEVARSEVREKSAVLGDLERRWKSMMDDFEDEEEESESGDEDEEDEEVKMEIGDSLEDFLGVVGARDLGTTDVLMT